MGSSPPDAIIILGHGSRVPESSQAMQKVAELLKEKYAHPVVETCYMSRLGPPFKQVFEKCVQNGAKNIILIPYFLHEGLHIKVDIPRMMQHCVQPYPDVRLMLGKSLGFDPVLADLIESRVNEHEHLCDVRGLTLPSEDKYPLPDGQCEFVPMTPKEAVEWKRKKYKERHLP